MYLPSIMTPLALLLDANKRHNPLHDKSLTNPQSSPPFVSYFSKSVSDSSLTASLLITKRREVEDTGGDTLKEGRDKGEEPRGEEDGRDESEEGSV